MMNFNMKCRSHTAKAGCICKKSVQLKNIQNSILHPALQPVFVYSNNSQRQGSVVRSRIVPSAAATANAVNLDVLIAGGGIGGLVLALALIKKGINVKVFERDVSSIRGEGKLRGPIQLQSNALATLEVIDVDAAKKIYANGTITGDRINGLCDGETGEWYVKFDTFKPAFERGLPITRVVSRMTLQEILTNRIEELRPGTILGDSQVTDYSQQKGENGSQIVTVSLENGKQYTGDILIGADGIGSKIRKMLVGTDPPVYSDYTVYTGISDFTPSDIDTVGYRVFLGNSQYFVSSDVGNGRMQWYAFHKEAPGGSDEPGTRKARLNEIFGHWSDMVTDLINSTPEEDVLRRDVYDRPPVFKWAEGNVAILGDAAHAMQPNLGQGGCMAIEDGFELAELLSEKINAGQSGNWEWVLKQYFAQRILRVSTIHGMARMAAYMASTYKAYLGEGLGHLGEGIGKWGDQLAKNLKIHHPGRVGGRAVMSLTMPMVLQWILGGNTDALDSAIARVKGGLSGRRSVEEYPEIDPAIFSTYMVDDEELVKGSNAVWYAVDEAKRSRDDPYDVKGGVVFGDEGMDLGGVKLVVEQGLCHAVVGGDVEGVRVADVNVGKGQRRVVMPGQVVQVDGKEWKVKQRHRSIQTKLETGASILVTAA